jgi:hypothetical protein
VLSKVKNVHILGQMVKYTLDHLNKVLCKAMVYEKWKMEKVILKDILKAI